MLSVSRWGISTDKRRDRPCRFDLRADGYDAVSGVPNYRESLRLDLNLEVNA